MGTKESPLSNDGMTTRQWLLVFVAWTLFGILLANLYIAGRLATGRPIESWSRPFVLFIIGSWQWAVYTPALVWLARRVPLERSGLARALALHTMAFLLVNGVDALLDLQVQALASAPTSPFRLQFFGMVQVNLLYYIATYIVTRLVASQHALRQRDLAAARLETRLAHAELEALRAQLHPHFLFNTLNAIASLMRTDVAAAEQMLTQLGEMLRVMIEQGGTQEVSVADEVEFLERYLAIERVRFSDRLVADVTVDPAVYGAAIPHLLLQPLVENAIRHGIGPRPSGGRVTVALSRVAQQLTCQVRDDGVGLPEGRTRGREGVGLGNTRARLQQLYGAQHRFDIVAGDGGGVAVLIAIPYHAAPVMAG